MRFRPTESLRRDTLHLIEMFVDCAVYSRVLGFMRCHPCLSELRWLSCLINFCFYKRRVTHVPETQIKLIVSPNFICMVSAFLFIVGSLSGVSSCVLCLSRTSLVMQCVIVTVTWLLSQPSTSILYVNAIAQLELLAWSMLQQWLPPFRLIIS